VALQAMHIISTLGCTSKGPMAFRAGSSPRYHAAMSLGLSFTRHNIHDTNNNVIGHTNHQPQECDRSHQSPTRPLYVHSLQGKME